MRALIELYAIVDKMKVVVESPLQIDQPILKTKF